MSDEFYFDEDAANRVKYFFETFLRHSKGQFAGKKFILLPWQWEGVIKPLFGWKRKDGTRKYRRAFIEIPKKNGKSTLCAGLSLYLLLGDNEPGAEIYIAAADREQASIVFNEAVSMVCSSPALYRRLHVKKAAKRIEYGNSFYKALSADVPTKEGLNIHGLIFDELHAQPNRKLWDTLKYGGASRRQPLFISITTAGYDKLSICYEQYQYAKQVLATPELDDGYFAYIAEADIHDDWKSPTTWFKANPSLGSTLQLDSFEADAKEAQQSILQENTFKRYRLNIWTEQETRFIPLDKWESCGRVPVQANALSKLECYGGLDLASTSDIAAFVLYFPKLRNVLAWFWVPEEAVGRRRKQQKQTIDRWVRDGLIRATSGDVIDYDTIRNDIVGFGQQFNIQEIAIDRWNSTQLQTQLQDDGFEIYKFGQGYASMSAPMKELERLVINGELFHGNNPVLNWMASNVAAEMDPAGNLKPSKKKSGEKIDGIVALLMALGQSMVHTESSAYDKEGITWASGGGLPYSVSTQRQSTMTRFGFQRISNVRPQ